MGTCTPLTFPERVRLTAEFYGQLTEACGQVMYAVDWQVKVLGCPFPTCPEPNHALWCTFDIGEWHYGRAVTYAALERAVSRSALATALARTVFNRYVNGYTAPEDSCYA